MKARALWAEFVGTFALIFVGMMAIATNEIQRGGVIDTMMRQSKGKGMANIALMGSMMQGDIGRVGIALAHGLVIAVMASAAMAVSGGHLNPAVTFGMWLSKRITAKRAFGYWVVQCAGGIAGALVANAVLPQDALQNLNLPNASFALPAVMKSLQDEGTSVVVMGIPLYALLIEAILTFFLMYVVLGTAGDRRAHKVGGLFIGLTVTLDILAGGPLTGAAMNPARWLGPAFLVSGQTVGAANPGMNVGTAAYVNWPVYILGPLIGAALASVVYGRLPEEQEVYGTEAELRSGVLPR